MAWSGALAIHAGVLLEAPNFAYYTYAVPLHYSIPHSALTLGHPLLTADHFQRVSCQRVVGTVHTLQSPEIGRTSRLIAIQGTSLLIPRGSGSPRPAVARRQMREHHGGRG